jgi:uncharacterized membrane protein
MSVDTHSVATERRWPPPPKSEHLWPTQLAIALAIALQLLLPDRLAVGSKWILPGLELLMLAVLAATSPLRLTTPHSRRRQLALTVVVVVSIANGISLALLAHFLFDHNVTNGHELIVAGSLIWLSNVLLFSLWYWELDRGGPGLRACGADEDPDFLFPQMAPDSPAPNWRPQFADYLYVSLTNAIAFSPTDTMPLSVMAKFVMGLQSLISLVTIGLVISRAVNIL